METQAGDLLRAGLLEGASVAVAGAPAGEIGAAVAAAAAGLGARVARVQLTAEEDAEEDEARAEAALAAALGELGSLDSLVVDAGSLYAPAAAWNAARAAANLSFVRDGGRIVLLGPSDGPEHARAAAAGLENTARTLSIEWARYGITTVAVAPGASTGAGDLAALACWLLSPAGAYFSGCLMDLRGPAAGRGPAGGG